MGEILTDDNYVMYAMKHYSNPYCRGVEEFQEDLNRIKYLKRLIRRYISSGELKDRLILNHIIIFYNVFGIEPATRILFSRIEEELHSILKTFIVFINNLPEKNIPEAELDRIPLDQDIVQYLRELECQQD
tara:strand:+ start:323 stop:715 length:393 start_codon:yes stop_codon:yes gene_type:complete